MVRELLNFAIELYPKLMTHWKDQTTLSQERSSDKLKIRILGITSNVLQTLNSTESDNVVVCALYSGPELNLGTEIYDPLISWKYLA